VTPGRADRDGVTYRSERAAGPEIHEGDEPAVRARNGSDPDIEGGQGAKAVSAAAPVTSEPVIERRSRSFFPIQVCVSAALLLATIACGLTDDADGITAGAAGPEAPDATAGDHPPVRTARSLCERVPETTVQHRRFDLEAGEPSERNGYPECHWRRPTGDVAVTARLKPTVGPEEFEAARVARGAEKVPDLGEAAFWSDDVGEGALAVLTADGVYEVVVHKFTDDDADIQPIAVDIFMALVENTEVPDTTTTTRPPEEPTGLCARFSHETAERAAQRALEPGVPVATAAFPERTCVFREVGRDGIIHVNLFDQEMYDLPPLTEFEETDALEVPARFDLALQAIDVRTDEGTLGIQILTPGLTDDEFRAGALALAEEFLASG
jgi:hypothetical protein